MIRKPTNMRMSTVTSPDQSTQKIWKIGTMFPIYSGYFGVPHVMLSVCHYWNGSSLQPHVVVPSCHPACRASYLVEAIPKPLRWFYYRFLNVSRVTERRFLRALRQYDAVYLFPGISADLIRRVKAAGKPLILERVNCHTAEAKVILDEAYEKLGLQPTHGITPEVVQREAQELALADYVFCPSPRVQASFLGAGVPEHKLILVSEGWEPSFFPPELNPRPVQDEVTVLFMGRVCVRKGSHLLLRAWEKAQIKGRLILVGEMEPAIAQSCAQILERPDVTHVGFQFDYKVFYSQADIFALPSLEEGSPLVTYEAMSRGLPILASPMGGGGIVRDGVDGLIIPPYDEAQWIESLRALAANPDLRQTMGAAARSQSLEYTWEKVAARRGAQLLAKLQQAF